MRSTSTAPRLGITVAVAALALALVPLALAGKGGNGGGGKPGGGGSTTSSSLSGPVMVTDLNGDGSPNHLDSITFDVSTTATAYPEVGLRCYQNSLLMYDGYVGYFATYMFNRWFALDSGYWADGVSATCDARLFYNDKRGRQHVLATTSFTVAP